jgi:hypothetical protein
MLYTVNYYLYEFKVINDVYLLIRYDGRQMDKGGQVSNHEKALKMYEEDEGHYA